MYNVAKNLDLASVDSCLDADGKRSEDCSMKSSHIIELIFVLEMHD